MTTSTCWRRITPPRGAGRHQEPRHAARSREGGAQRHRVLAREARRARAGLARALRAGRARAPGSARVLHADGRYGLSAAHRACATSRRTRRSSSITSRRCRAWSRCIPRSRCRPSRKRRRCRSRGANLCSAARRLRASVSVLRSRRIAVSMFLNALNSSALPDGSSRNIVACSPGKPLKRTYGSITNFSPALADALGERMERLHLQHHTAMRHRHAVPVHMIVVLPDLAVLAERRVQVTHELVAEQIEVDPLRVAAAFGAPERVLVEAPRFGDVAHLHGDVERGQGQGDYLEVCAPAAEGSPDAARRSSPAP